MKGDPMHDADDLVAARDAQRVLTVISVILIAALLALAWWLIP